MNKKGNIMSAIASTIPTISLTEGFGALVVQGPNIKVEIFADGNVNVQTQGRVTTNGPAVTDSFVRAHKIGAVMPDGSIYAGFSPNTGKPMYTTPEDAPLLHTFDKAAQYASYLDAHGKRDWRVPTKDELNVLFLNHAAIGCFNLNGLPPGTYWSSSRTYRWSARRYYDGAWTQRFHDGAQGCNDRDNVKSALRCVRG